MIEIIKVLLVDDHPIIRDAIKLYFESIEDITIAGEADNGQEALELLKANQYDLVITDIVMPEMNGVELLTEMQQIYPQQNVLVLSMINEASQVKKMIALGARGYVLKNSPKEEILDAIHTISKGDTYYSKEVFEIIMGQIAGRKPKQRLTVEIPLTRREKEIVKLVMEEFTNQEIADKLFLSVRTVEAHKRNILEKTGCKTVAGLAIYAIERGII